MEKLRNEKCLIYLLLDGVKAPNYDSNRIYVDGTKNLRIVGSELMHAITGMSKAPQPYVYDEEKPL